MKITVESENPVTVAETSTVAQVPSAPAQVVKPGSRAPKKDKAAMREMEDKKWAADKAKADKEGRTHMVTEITPADEATVPDAAPAAEAQQTPPSRARKTESVTTKHGEFRAGSVLLHIYECLDSPKGMTKAEIVDYLAARHPDRPREHLQSTVNTQLHRMPNEREFELGRDDEGRYGINIDGKSKVRVLSPEAAAKAQERKEQAAAAKAAKEQEAAEKAAAVQKAIDEDPRRGGKAPAAKKTAKKGGGKAKETAAPAAE